MDQLEGDAHAVGTAPVVISGGGPVGLGLAITLAQGGVRSVVVERYPQPNPIPRGQNLTQRTMEHFYFWGIESELRAARTMPKAFGIGGMTSYGTLAGDYHYDWLQRALVRPFYFTDNERLPQYATEAVLRRRAAALPEIELLFGWNVEDVRQDARGVEVAVAERNGPGRRTLQATYAVGCDGGRSVVRERAGITQTRSDHDRLMVLLVFRSRALHRLLLERFPGKSYFNVLHPALEGYWRFFGRVDLEGTFFFHAPVPLDTTRENGDFPALVRAAVGAPVDVELDVAIDHVGFWDLRFAVADDYRAGRLFVAGDAAHSHPPYGGYGINTGFEDAVNLGWKLVASLSGWGGPTLLNSYSAERQPVFASTARDFIEASILSDRDFLRAFDPARDRRGFEKAWNTRAEAAAGEVGSFEPNYEGSPIAFAAMGRHPSAVGRHDFAARPGHHLAPQRLSDGRDVFDHLDGRFALIALGAGEAGIAGFTRAAKRLGVPMHVLRENGAPQRDHWGAGLVLVRPDQFVAWTDAAGPAEPEAVLRRSVGYEHGDDHA